MPRYVYKCDNCNIEVEHYHGIAEKMELCEKCNEKTLYKVPSFSGMLKKHSSPKVGAIVENYIEETREEIRKQKEDLAKKEYKPE